MFDDISAKRIKFNHFIKKGKNMSEITSQDQTTSTPVVETPQLTWDTLNLVVQVIDLAFERRAFGGLSEIHVVLNVRNEVQKFVEHMRPQVEAEKARLQAEKEAEAAVVANKAEMAEVVGDTKKVVAKKTTKAKSVKSK